MWVAAALAFVALVALVALGGGSLTLQSSLQILPVIGVVAVAVVVHRIALVVLRARRRAAEERATPGGLRLRGGRGKSAPGTAWFRAEPTEDTEIRRFRVMGVSGDVVECELIGEMQEAPLARGDVVDVYGRRTRPGPVRVREVVITATQARVRARPGAAFLLVRWGDIGALALAGTCVAGVVYLLLVR